jgi:cob(I)alamin adenosyltransferase
MKTYTRTGDSGSTSLSGGKRVPKCHERVEAYGTIDELISWTGLLRDFPENAKRKKTLIFIQDQLMRCAACLASEKPKAESGICLPEPGSIEFIEKEIDEIRVVKLNETEKVHEIIISFLNRLSDYFFVLGRKLCSELDIEEVRWLV